MRGRRTRVRLLGLGMAAVVAAAVGWGALRLVKAGVTTAPEGDVPTTRVKKGKVVVGVSARGELQGGNSEMLNAPTAGGGDLPITYLREPGEVVEAGDVVVTWPKRNSR